jgi:hypothetical protein
VPEALEEDHDVANRRDLSSPRLQGEHRTEIADHLNISIEIQNFCVNLGQQPVQDQPGRDDMGTVQYACVIPEVFDVFLLANLGDDAILCSVSGADVENKDVALITRRMRAGLRRAQQRLEEISGVRDVTNAMHVELRRKSKRWGTSPDALRGNNSMTGR